VAGADLAHGTALAVVEFAATFDAIIPLRAVQVFRTLLAEGDFRMADGGIEVRG
jgi:hypothetical protein